MQALLEGRGVSVSYGGVAAVDSVDFEVGRGQLHGVIGPNGAGKSSFMDALSGRRRPTKGTVLFEGDDITRVSARRRRLRGITRSFQRTSVFGSLTVGQQLELVTGKLGATREMEAIVERFDLRPLLAHPCSEISYGDQRSVDLALALVGRPKVVLLDEPGAGLTATETIRMFDHLRDLCTSQNIAAVIVEHDVEGVFRVCDEVTVLDLGRVLISGAPSVVRADPEVIRAYLGSAA